MRAELGAPDQDKPAHTTKPQYTGMIMAQHSTLENSTVPTPPPRETTRRLLLRGFWTWCITLILAWSAFLNAFGIEAFIAIAIITGLVLLALSSSLITQNRPVQFPWRRLPWFAVAYVAFGILSIFWSQWRNVSIITSLLMLGVTFAAVMISYTLTWREVLGCLGTALKWIVALSIALELWVALFVGHGIFPHGFEKPANGEVTEHMQWVWGNLFHFGERIQGIVGNANTLGLLSAVAIVVFIALALDAVGRKRIMLFVWVALAAFLFVRAESATTIVASVLVALIVGAALLMRQATTPNQRRNRYLGVFVAGGVTGVTALVLRHQVLALLDRDPTLTGRTEIWAVVSERAAQHPIIGNGFASPWIPIDEHFDGWIVDNGLNVMHAHSAWLDAYLQLGAIGVFLGLAASAALLWRAWFFAVDRPRIDLRDDREYTPLTLVPLALTALLLTLSLTESTPLLANGWFLGVLFAFKMKINQVISSSREPFPERSRTR